MLSDFVPSSCPKRLVSARRPASYHRAVDAAGHWKVRKIKQSQKIDRLVASVIAHDCARVMDTLDGGVVYF